MRKTNYITPQTEVINLQIEDAVLLNSGLEADDSAGVLNVNEW